jgi:hypothetical protein
MYHYGMYGNPYTGMATADELKFKEYLKPSETNPDPRVKPEKQDSYREDDYHAQKLGDKPTLVKQTDTDHDDTRRILDFGQEEPTAYKELETEEATKNREMTIAQKYRERQLEALELRKLVEGMSPINKDSDNEPIQRQGLTDHRDKGDCLKSNQK